MKIAVIGGGIVGLSAVRLLTKVYGENDVTLFSDNIGGEFRAGGLKYIKHTSNVDKFLNHLGVSYSLSKVNGAISVGGEILSFPDYLLNFPAKLSHIQKAYYKKTRGDSSKFNPTCMNDPFNVRNDLNVGVNLSQFFWELEISVRPYWNQNIPQVTQEYLKDIIKNFDLIIYTIPIELLLSSMGSKPKVKSNRLRITKIRVNDLDRVWWDYLYIHEQKYPFHRISKEIVDFGYYLIFETNDQFTDLGERALLDSMLDFLEQIDCGVFSDKMGYNKTFFIKGQLIDQHNQGDIMAGCEGVELDKVFLLGRFAQNDSRMTYNKALDRMYSEFPKLLEKENNG